MADLPRVEIEYCTQCRWLLRAAWMAQELLTTFEQEVGAVALRPGTGGVFEVRMDGASVWSRKAEGRFPDIKELKQRVRDRIAPDKPRAFRQADRVKQALQRRRPLNRCNPSLHKFPAAPGRLIIQLVGNFSRIPR